MQIEKIKLDTKGRIVLPVKFREYLGLSNGDEMFASLDEKTQSLVLSAHAETEVYLLKIEMSDAPGTLAKLAKVLADNKVDLISTESHSITRMKNAVWRVVCKLKKEKIERIKKDLRKNGAVSVEINLL